MLVTILIAYAIAVIFYMTKVEVRRCFEDFPDCLKSIEQNLLLQAD